MTKPLISAPPPATALQLEQVGLYRQGRWLLQSVSLSLSAPGVTALIGHNGAGKSLLMQVCNRLLAVDAGTITWPAPPAQGIAQLLLPQQALVMRRSVEQNIAHSLRLAGAKRPVIDARTEQALQLAKLETKRRQAATTLSGGEKQRLALARGWALQAAWLWLDEPCAHLDPEQTERVEQLINTLRDQGTKVVLCTHDWDQAKRLADDVVLLARGQVQRHQPAAGFFATEPQRG